MMLAREESAENVENMAENVEDMAYWTFTVTFRDRAITYPTGAQKKQYGRAMPGFSTEDFDRIEQNAKKLQLPCYREKLNDLLPEELAATSEHAEVLILPGALKFLLGEKDSSDMEACLFATDFNEKAISLYNKKKKVKRHAQQSVVFATDEDRQELKDPEDSQEYQAVVHSMTDLTHGQRLCQIISKLAERPDLAECVAECNCYKNTRKKPGQCGVGFHGDQESDVVWALRKGNAMYLSYQWFLRNLPVGARFCRELESDTIYFMSKKAVGNDYKKSSILTLRHAAGGEKYAPDNSKWQQEEKNEKEGKGQKKRKEQKGQKEKKGEGTVEAARPRRKKERQDPRQLSEPSQPSQQSDFVPLRTLSLFANCSTTPH
jgi:hypothetical protein